MSNDEALAGRPRLRAPRRDWHTPPLTQPADESLGTSTPGLGDGVGRAFAPSTAAADAESILDAGWAEEVDEASRSAAPPVPDAADETESALTRISRTYAAARAAIGLALTVGVGAFSVLGVRPGLPVVLVCLAYALQALLLWLLPRFGALTRPRPRDGTAQRRRQWLATIGVDLAAFTVLHVLASEASLNFAALLVLPVLMSGVLTSRLLALATAAGVALMLLGVAWYGAAGSAGGAVLVAQSGVAGLGFFLIALLSGELAGRLAREERAARGSLELARRQARLNRLVIEEMADGVLVVDREGRVRASNPAARSLLAPRGATTAAPMQIQGRPEWAALAAAMQRALAEGRWPEAGEEVVLNFGAGDSRTLRMRVRFTRRRTPRAAAGATAEEYCVLLLEDVRTAQARLRQEKLAAMGRVSAGIAHEIRNPLAAISQANALLLEDALPEPQRRLARIVADNVERLRRIVEDVMEVAPGMAPQSAVIDAAAEVRAVATEWARTAQVELGPGGRLRLDLPMVTLPVTFDREHLRRVLVNLLDNAQRHAGNGAGAIVLRLAPRDESTALLLVDSDGAPLPPEVERHLFEPFFSTRSRGTGLGLYICRELCERYGASIEYRARPDGPRNLFLVIMQRSTASGTRAAGRPAA